MIGIKEGVFAFHFTFVYHEIFIRVKAKTFGGGGNFCIGRVCFWERRKDRDRSMDFCSFEGDDVMMIKWYFNRLTLMNQIFNDPRWLDTYKTEDSSMSSFKTRVTSIPSAAAGRGFPTPLARYIYSKEGKEGRGQGEAKRGEEDFVA